MHISPACSSRCAPFAAVYFQGNNADTGLLMIGLILKNMLAAFILSLVLLTVALAGKYLMKESETTLQDILFWVGAVPIVLFSIGLIGIFFGRGDPSYPLSRSVSNQSSIQRGLQDIIDIKSRVTSGLNWILAGLFVWFYSYFM
jgi:hypothetical protein